METGARADPQYYLDYLTAWAQDSRAVRLAITGTEVNALVYLEEVAQGERDGTGDRYVTVSVREHEALEAAETANPNGNAQNASRPPGTTAGVVLHHRAGRSPLHHLPAVLRVVHRQVLQRSGAVQRHQKPAPDLSGDHDPYSAGERAVAIRIIFE